MSDGDNKDHLIPGNRVGMWSPSKTPSTVPESLGSTHTTSSPLPCTAVYDGTVSYVPPLATKVLIAAINHCVNLSGELRRLAVFFLVGVDEALADGVAHEFSAAIGAELSHDAANVGFDCTLGEEKLHRHLFV